MSASDVIARLRELRAKATAGEWRANGGTYIYPLDRCYPSKDRIADCGGIDAFTNAAAIVAAMNSLDALLECAEALETVRGCGVLPISVGRIVDAALQALAEGGGE